MANNLNDWETLHPDDWAPISPQPIKEAPPMSKEDTLKALLNKDLENAALSGEAVGNVLEKYNQYITGPIRKFITEKVTGKPLEQAPSGKEQAAMMGLSTEQYGLPGVDWSPTVSPAGVAGLGLEIAQDPLSYVGLVKEPLKKGVATALEKTGTAAEWAAKKAGKAGFNIPEAYTEKYLAKKGVIEAPEKINIMNDLTDLYNSSQSKLEQAATKQNLAKGELSDLKQSISNEWRDKKFSVKNELDDAKSAVQDKAKQLKEHLNRDLVTPLRHNVMDSMETLKGDLSKLSGESYKILEKDPNAYSVRQAGRVLREMAADLNIQPFEENALAIKGQISPGVPLTPETKSLQNKIIQLAESFENTPEKVPAKELKKMIQQLDASAMANYNSLEFDSRVSEAYKMARATIDAAIKKANPAYAEKMAELAPKTELYSQAVEKFGKPEQIISKLNGMASKVGQNVDFELLNKLGDVTGKDFKTPVGQFIENQNIVKNPSAFNRIIQEMPETKKLTELQQAWNVLQNPETERSLWQNPKWMEAEAKSGTAIKELEKAQQEAALFRGLSPSTVESKVKALTGARQYGPTEYFEQLKQATGRDFAQEIRDRELLDQFMKTDTQGSRKAVVGGTIGSAIGYKLGGGPGGTIGAALGAGAGGALDRYGGQVFKKGLDVGLKGAETAKALGTAVEKGIETIPSLTPREMLYKQLMQKYFEAPSDQLKEKKVPDQGSILEKVKGTPYEAILQRSLQNGGDRSFAAANYVLKNRDQKYRDLFNEEEA